jgi:type IV secretion system protein VirD4
MDVFKLLLNLVKLLLRAFFHVLIWLFGALGRLWRGYRRRRAQTHGSARFATAFEIWRSGAFGGDGMIIGRKLGRLLRLNRPGFLLCVAKTRAGKTTSLVVPTILASPKRSLIVIDVKGEIAAITRRARAKVGKVYTLSLTDPLSSDCWNPLDFIRGPDVDCGIHEADDAMILAHLLIDDTPTKDPHWNQKASELLAALLIFVTRRYAGEPLLKTLAKVRSLTASGLEGISAVLEDADTLGSTVLSEVASAVRAAAASGSNEYNSIVSTADKALALFSHDRPGNTVTRKSEFNPADFSEGVATLYLQISEAQMPIYRPALRLFIGTLINTLTRQKEFAPEVRTTFILDEAASLGNMPELEQAAAILGSYASMMLIYQDISQIQANFKKLGTILGNAAAFVSFGTKDIDTAKRLSEMLGTKNQLSTSEGASQANTAILARQNSQGMSETGRALLDPSEILRLDDKDLLVFLDGVKYPIKAAKAPYYKLWRFRGMYDAWRQKRRKPEPTVASGPLSPQP